MKAVTQNNRKIRRRMAFTLVEVMVAIMLTTIVLTSIYMIWSRVQRGMARSNTRQTLQNELRNVANYMQNDFKSIKFDEDNFSLSEGSNGNFSMSFEKFKETEDGKLAQDSTEKVTYKLTNSMLTRSLIGPNILSLHCDGVWIKRAVDDISLSSSGETSVNLESLSKDFKAGREAKLEIEVMGKMKVPGTGEEMYHTEKTSVVMRNEYYKKINKTYISNFDFNKKNLDEVILAGNSDAFGDGSFDYEYLLTLNDEALNSLEQAQNELLEKTEENLENCNKQINETSTGQSFLGEVCDFFNFFTYSDEEKVNDWRGQLAAAKKEDEVNKVKSELDEWVTDKKLDYLSKATDGRYNRMDDEEKEIYRIAYDMKVQDRTSQKAYEKQLEATGEGDEQPKEPTRLIDVYQQQVSKDSGLKDADGNTINLTQGTEGSDSDSERTSKVLAAYESIKLEWMDELEQDMNTYAAANSLISQAETKLEILKMIDMYNENINNIGKAKVDPKRPRN